MMFGIESLVGKAVEARVTRSDSGQKRGDCFDAFRDVSEEYAFDWYGERCGRALG